MKNILNKIELAIFFSALFIGTIASSFFYKQGMLAILVDENAHLNIARQVIDSMTPGFSQLGLWPPLFHLIMVPFVWSDFLWRSGLAGSVNILFYAIACVFVFKIVKFFSKDNLPAIISVLIFGFNPYVIYFSTVAMMEIPFLMNFIIAVYYFTKWIKKDSLSNLTLCALFTALAGLTRFEGFILPIVFAGIISIKYLLTHKKYHQTEAVIIIFSMLSGFGIFLALLYSTIFAGNPLAFISGEWSAYAQQHEGGYVLPAQGNVFNSFLYMFSATNYMIGYGLVILASIIFLYFLFKRDVQKILILLILAIPFLFNILSLFRGNTVVYTPDLAPFAGFLNVRYGLLLVLFTSVAPGLFLALSSLVRKRQVILRYCFCGIVITILSIFSISNFSYKNSVIIEDAKNYPSEEMIESAKIFNKEYDGGKLLITRGVNDFFTKNSGIDIFSMIQESNYIYWEQSLKDPWLFARWIVMLNPDSTMIWETKKDEISVRWSRDNKIYNLYDVVLKNNTYIILKINDNKMKQYAGTRDFNLSQIPSLNPKIDWWDTKTIHQKISPTLSR